MNSSVVISGANGFVGRNVGMFLSKNGFQTTSLVRKGRTVNFGNTITTANLSENNLASRIQGADAFLHFIGQGRQTVDYDYGTVNISLARNADALCKKEKIKKIIVIMNTTELFLTKLVDFKSKISSNQPYQSSVPFLLFKDYLRKLYMWYKELDITTKWDHSIYTNDEHNLIHLIEPKLTLQTNNLENLRIN